MKALKGVGTVPALTVGLALMALLFSIPLGCMEDRTIDPLSKEERAWLSEHDGKIRLAHDPNARPVDFLDQEGKFNGLAADYVRLLEKRLDFKFDILKIKTWDEVVRRAKKREIDVLCAFSKSEKREQWMLFTDPYLVIKTVILTRNDFKGDISLDTMKDIKITFTKGWVVEDYLRKNYSQLNMLPAADADAAMNNLLTEKADAWITALTVASIKIENTRVTNIRVAGETDLSFKLAFASRKDWPILNRILKKGLALISESERSDIFKKWIHIDRQSIFGSRFFWTVAFIILGVSVLPVIFVTLWNTALKRRVDQKTAELEQERSLFKAIVDRVPVMITRYDPSANVLFLNHEFERIIGWKTEEVQHINLMEEVYPDPEDRRQAYEYMQKPAKDWKEFRLQSKSGRFIESEWSNVRLEDGTQIGIGIDVMEKKRVDEALKRSQSFLKESMEAMSDAVFISDSNGRFVEFNTAFATFHRLSSKDECHETLPEWHDFLEVYLPDGSLASKENWAVPRALRGETGIDVEYILKRKDTKETWIGSYNFAPIKNPLGDIIGSVVVGRDITRQKQAEEELSKQKKLFETMFDTIPDGVVITNNKREIRLANQGMASTFGYKPEELFGKTTEMLYADASGYLGAGASTFGDDSQESDGLYVARYRKKDGAEFSGETFGAKLFDEKNEWIGNLGIIRDITEREQAELRIQQAQRIESIGYLAGGIAHDFNNILFPIIGMSEMLMEDLPPDTPEWESAGEIFKAGKRGRDLVKQILSFSRQDDHKMAPTRVQSILKEVLTLSRSTLPSYIEIEQNIQQDCGLIMGDPTQVHQVVMNIITNAFHAVEADGGRIFVTLKEQMLETEDFPEANLAPGKYAVISISDTGHGISADLIDKIFDPYFTTKEKGKGTGLGLSVVHGIIKEHRGTIKIYSEIAKGTTFHVYLPLMDKTIHPETVDATDAHPVGNERILLVDDEEPIAKLGKQILERLGYRVSYRLSAMEALEDFRAAPSIFDLVITDMSMPQMAGDQLAKAILSIRPDVRIIVCTGFSERIDKKKASAIGIKALLMKPVLRADMAKTVRSVLDEVKKIHQE